MLQKIARFIAAVIGGGTKAPDGTGLARAGIGKSIAPTIASRMEAE